jgi:hypothetical protein
MTKASGATGPDASMGLLYALELRRCARGKESSPPDVMEGDA